MVGKCAALVRPGSSTLLLAKGVFINFSSRHQFIFDGVLWWNELFSKNECSLWSLGRKGGVGVLVVGIFFKKRFFLLSTG